MQRSIRAIALLLLFFFTVETSFSQYQPDKKLEEKLRTLTDTFHGVAGIYVKNLRTGKTVAINADTVFPTASIVKVPILLGIMDRLGKKELDYDQQLVYRDSLAYSDYDILASFKDTTKVLLKKVIMMMLTTSDNSA